MLVTLLMSCTSGPELPELGAPEWAGWDGPEPAVVVDRGGGNALGVSATSTATVRYKEAGEERLRIFGVGSDKFRNHELQFDMPAQPRCDQPADAYLEWLSTADGEFRFTERGASPCTKTCVPAMRNAETVKLRVRTSHKPPKDELRDVELRTVYRDPAVLYVPDLGWLLLQTRTRNQASATGPQTPKNSLGDIVAWLSPSGAFDRDVKGPLVVVDDFQAVPDQVHRNWLGVPAVALLDQGTEKHLLVHYAASVPDQPYLDGNDAYPPSEDLRVGAAAKKIPVNALARAFDKPPKGGSAPGQLLGHVNIWVAVGGTAAAPEVVPHGSLYEFPWHAVDPHPLTCEAGLQLFFANLPKGASAAGLGADTGLGVWHASGFDEGVVLSTPEGPHTTRLGLDFVVAPAGANGLSRDQVAPDPETGGEHNRRVFIDPDPVRMSDGSFNVYTGTWDSASLMRFQGDSSLGCRSWKDAFSR